MILLGVMYGGGEGVRQDDAQAFRWFEKAALGGSGMAMYNLAMMYENGTGVPKSREKALTWYGKAASAGIQEANEKIR